MGLQGMCNLAVVKWVLCYIIPRASRWFSVSELRLAVSMVLAAYRAFIVLGVECSTFVFMNSGTSKRSWATPMGHTVRASVQAANQYASRRGRINSYIVLLFRSSI